VSRESWGSSAVTQYQPHRVCVGREQGCIVLIAVNIFFFAQSHHNSKNWADQSPISCCLALQQLMTDAIQVADTSEFLAIVDRQTTGGHVWDAARRLKDYILAENALAGCSSVLELGAGTGWLGMSLALQLRGLTRVALTELEDGNACEWLRYNVERNRERLSGISATDALGGVEVAPLDWACVADGGGGLPANLVVEGWDVVIGSDLIYNSTGAALLPRVLRALLTERAGSPPRVLYAHTRYRFEHLDRDFLAECARLGLALNRVWPADGARPHSPPPYTELFPEQYIVIWSVARAR